ncbi:MAG: hypothetical protein ACI9BK_002713 [Acidimicrobiales bacterium]|jgi:hypothetical protein
MDKNWDVGAKWACKWAAKNRSTFIMVEES